MKNSALPIFPFLLCLLSFSMFGQADTPLEKKMDQMKKAYKELSKSIEKPVESEKMRYQKLAEELRDLMKESGKLSPQKTEMIPADQRGAFIEGYQKAINQSVATLEALIQAIQTSNWSEAQKLMALLKQHQKEGHQEYRAERP